MTEMLEKEELESLDVSGIGILEPGLTIEHPSLGLGTVENIYQLISTSEVTIRVKFNDYGSKIINPKHAHLSLVTEPEPTSFFEKCLNLFFAW